LATTTRIGRAGPECVRGGRSARCQRLGNLNDVPSRVTPDLPRALARALPRGVVDVPRLAAGVAVEAGWTAAHLTMYPLGLLALPVQAARDGMADLTAEQRGLLHTGVDEARTPILLVHGIVDNHSVFTVLERALRRRGFSSFSAFDYGLLTRDIPQAAEKLGDAVEKLAANTGYERVHMVGHSLGGLIARFYIQRLGGDAFVHTLVTLGTPHEGTARARTLPFPLLQQLTPNSPVIRALAEPAPGCRTRFLAFASDLDHLIGPTRNAMVLHPDLNARNVVVRGVGHLSMPHNGKIAFEIAAALRDLDPQG
jgi:triacylglycerol lipase